jgi:hypothetical protein
MAGILGLALVSPLTRGHAAETRTSISVSAVVANRCTVSLARVGGAGISRRCAWPQPATFSATVASPNIGTEEAQGIRYLAVEY